MPHPELCSPGSHLSISFPHTSRAWAAVQMHQPSTHSPSDSFLAAFQMRSGDGNWWCVPCEGSTTSATLERLQNITKEGEPFVWPVPSPGTNSASTAAPSPRGRQRGRKPGCPVCCLNSGSFPFRWRHKGGQASQKKSILGCSFASKPTKNRKRNA